MIKSWIKKNTLQIFLLVLMLGVGAYLRLYKIDTFMTFLGDEGRDMVIIRKLLREGDPVLIGPGTSVGDMYLGPLYYYLVAPALFLANFNPVGPSILVALIGVATIFLVWKFVSDLGSGSIAALVAAGLYAVSPTAVIFSRTSWNPNVMPFFSLLTLYALWKIYGEGKYRWFIVMGISFSFVLQSHYLGLLLAPVMLLYLIKVWRSTKSKYFVNNLVAGLVVFGFLMSPLLIFDLRHNFLNFNALKSFLVSDGDGVGLSLLGVAGSVWPNFKLIVTRLVGVRSKLVGLLLSGFIIAGFLWAWKKFSGERRVLGFVGGWFIFGVFGLGVYGGEVYDHYFGFLFPVPFILLGILSSIVIQKVKYLRVPVVMGLIYLFYLSYVGHPLRHPGRQLIRTQETANKIIEVSGGEKYNFAVIADRNYEEAYEYFLDDKSDLRVDIDSLRTDETLLNQLFVVCELPQKDCDPTHNAKAGIANFGWSEIDDKWEVGGVILYKLIHAK